MGKLRSTINHIYQKIRVSRKIKNLSIKSAGIDEEGMPYVELKYGLKFFGLPISPKDRKYYAMLVPGSIKTVLPQECYRVAMDIVIRYQEGGLMLGGPRKEDYYKVKKGDSVAEMGAFLGYYSMYLAETVGPTGTIIAIEPLPKNLSILSKNIERNGLDNIKLVPKGV